MKIGDKVLISPDLTNHEDWIEGVVIDVEDNTIHGKVISAETKDGKVFFGQASLFTKK